jgi:alpha/beta superfamily hydrolase
MNLRTLRRTVEGPAGPLQCAFDESGHGQPLGVVLLCHPHPLHGGTMDNKVVQTLARSFVQLGWRSVRFNFRGVGESAGRWDHGHGEIDDAWAVLQAARAADEPVAIGGFSFGGYVATHVARRLADGSHPARHVVLVGTAVSSFESAAVDSRALVIHGETDDVVPLPAVFDWARPQSLPVTVVPGAGHFFHGQLGLLKQIVLNHCRD